MLSEDSVLKNEIINEGDKIHLYFSPMYGEYVAYGYSAFIAKQNCMQEGQVLKEFYSVGFQMPIVRVNEQQVKLILSKGIKLNNSIEKSYYHIKSFIPFDERSYVKWAYNMRGR